MRTQVITCLVEGCSIRATVRMTGISKKAVSRLLVDAGRVCADYQDEVFRNLPCRRLQLDELWGFNYCKQKNVTPEIAEKVPGAGDVWLWTPSTQILSSCHHGCSEIGASEQRARS